ncbi:MAG: J domain-containing protein [Planctomycetales bacterium]|nr:J domain-containing protein [Planctomycetales bacterium]
MPLASGSSCFYQLLGVPRTASPAEIRQAFLRSARDCHPDLNPTAGDAELRFKQIRRIYEILSDPILRAAYDEDPSRFELREGGALVNEFTTVVTRPQPARVWPSNPAGTPGGRPFVAHSPRSSARHGRRTFASVIVVAVLVSGVSLLVTQRYGHRYAPPRGVVPVVPRSPVVNEAQLRRPANRVEARHKQAAEQVRESIETLRQDHVPQDEFAPPLPEIPRNRDELLPPSRSPGLRMDTVQSPELPEPKMWLATPSQPTIPFEPATNFASAFAGTPFATELSAPPTSPHLAAMAPEYNAFTTRQPDLTVPQTSPIFHETSVAGIWPNVSGSPEPFSGGSAASGSFGSFWSQPGPVPSGSLSAPGFSAVPAPPAIPNPIGDALAKSGFALNGQRSQAILPTPLVVPSGLQPDGLKMLGFATTTSNAAPASPWMTVGPSGVSPNPSPLNAVGNAFGQPASNVFAPVTGSFTPVP